MGNNLSSADGCCGLMSKVWNCNVTDYVKDPVLMKRLTSETGFTERQIQRLKARFNDLGGKKTGYLTSEDLLKISVFCRNPIAPQIIFAIYKERFDPSAIKVDLPQFEYIRIPFESFVKAFARFRPLDRDPESENKFNTYEGKCLFLFRILDINEDKVVRISEITDLLKSLAPFEKPEVIERTGQGLIMEWQKEMNNANIAVSFRDFVRSETVRRIAKSLYFQISC